MTPEQMEARVSRALDLHKDGFNCAQCVACACAGEVGMDEDLAFRMMEGFGGGMGRFDQTCGAISGGVAVLGMQRSGGPAAKPRTKGATYKLSKRLTQEFAAANGSTSATSSRAPGKTVTRVSPVPSVRIAARAEGVSLPTTVPAIPSRARNSRTFASSSAPTAVRNATSAPCRAAATAWLKPLPPHSSWRPSAWIVSPPEWKRGTSKNSDLPTSPIIAMRDIF